MPAPAWAPPSKLESFNKKKGTTKLAQAWGDSGVSDRRSARERDEEEREREATYKRLFKKYAKRSSDRMTLDELTKAFGE